MQCSWGGKENVKLPFSFLRPVPPLVRAARVAPIFFSSIVYHNFFPFDLLCIPRIGSDLVVSPCTHPHRTPCVFLSFVAVLEISCSLLAFGCLSLLSHNISQIIIIMHHDLSLCIPLLSPRQKHDPRRDIASSWSFLFAYLPTLSSPPNLLCMLWQVLTDIILASAHLYHTFFFSRCFINHHDPTPTLYNHTATKGL